MDLDWWPARHSARRVGRGWGADATVSYVIAMANGKLRPISQLSDGFLRPRFPEETQFSYYEASLFCEMVEASRGAACVRRGSPSGPNVSNGSCAASIEPEVASSNSQSPSFAS